MASLANIFLGQLKSERKFAATGNNFLKRCIQVYSKLMNKHGNLVATAVSLSCKTRRLLFSARLQENRILSMDENPIRRILH